jgi:CheY-like chemotaxis protein
MPASLPRILVIHRKPEAAAERARRLCAEGFDASAYPAFGPSAFRSIRADPPDAILIDLTELPSYGRTMGVLLRQQKGTRAIPLVFLKGDPEKAAQVRESLPDAVFATGPTVAAAILRAIRRPPKEPSAPVAPQVPLARKLRIRQDSVVALLHAPADIRTLLGALPTGVRLQKQIDGAGVILLFVKSAAALGSALPALAPGMQSGRTLWVCWPKRTSAQPCDLTANLIRDMASPYNLVDSKLCAMDETWSATALSKRRPPRFSTASF